MTSIKKKKKPLSFELVWPCYLEKQCAQIKIFSPFLFLRIFNSVFNASEINLTHFGENLPSALFSFCTNTLQNLVKLGGLPSVTRFAVQPQGGCRGCWGDNERWQCVSYQRSSCSGWWDKRCIPSEPHGKQAVIIWMGQMSCKYMKCGACRENGGHGSLRSRITQRKRMWPFKIILYKIPNYIGHA